MRSEDKERILTELRARVSHKYIDAAKDAGKALDEILAESIYHERRRLDGDPKSPNLKRDQLFWNDIQKRLNRAGERELRALVTQVVEHYATEVQGHFDPRVYEVATRMLPPALGVLLNASSPRRVAQRLFQHKSAPQALAEFPRLDDAVIVSGQIDQLRRLHELGTVILAPTHVSNLDSIVLGYAIYKLGLPPFVYGAGLNLFTNPVMGYFMHNLGAYTVDRQKKDPLYKEVLKAYATLTLEAGYDNLFFPGGTRARSGAIERKLKLGLMGASIDAYINNLRRHVMRPKIYIVPCTLSFQLVLEAETLIDDFLREVGKSRYIITDDEFSKPLRIYEFVTQLFNLNSNIYVTLGEAYDPFGNRVDENGESLDPCGRVIDSSRYVLVDGEPAPLRQRDAEYTSEVGERLVEAYARDNVVQSTHVTARVLFDMLREANLNVDLLRLLRVGGRYGDFEMGQVHEEMASMLEALRALAAAGGIRLAPLLQNGAPHDVVAEGLKHFAIYHKKPAARRLGDRIEVCDRSLLFYYQNRLEGYRLGFQTARQGSLSLDRRQLGAA